MLNGPGSCVAATIQPSVETTGSVAENAVFYSSFVISSMGFLLQPPPPPLPYRVAAMEVSEPTRTSYQF
jgi:hypothetical protein